jgi:hypothetical protein
MYLRLIDEAVRELERKEGEEEPPEVYLELNTADISLTHT